MSADLLRRPVGFPLGWPLRRERRDGSSARACYVAWALVMLLASFGAPAPLQAAYTPYYTDTFGTIDSTKWYQNGSLTGNGGMTSYGLSGNGSLISKLTPPALSTDYQVETGIRIDDTSSNVYVHYLRASNDARSGSTPQGSYYAIELQSPSFSPSAEIGTATLAVYKRANAVVTQLGSTTVPVKKGAINWTTYNSSTVIRSVIRGSQIFVYVDGVQYFSLTDSTLTSGMPGVGIVGQYMRVPSMPCRPRQSILRP